MAETGGNGDRCLTDLHQPVHVWFEARQVLAQCRELQVVDDH